MTLISMNPATGEELDRYREASAAEVAATLDKAQAAFDRWRVTPIENRAELFGELAAVLRANKDELAELATLEMGKILSESAAEVEKSAGFCEYYAARAPEYLASHRIEGGQLENWVRYDPIGIVLAIMPWNFPYVQVFRFGPAAIVAGNVAVLKHSPNVPQCALKIEEMFRHAGFPEGVFQTLLVEPPAVEAILEDPRVQGVTLTGSPRAGSSVASIAGRELKTSVMELGGSDPFIVLEDADIAAAASEGSRSRNINAGQACIAAKRFIVLDSVADAFEQALASEVAALTVGDPCDPDTDVGPLARQDLVDTLRSQVEDSTARGAVVKVGGFDWDGGGSFVRPLVLTHVSPEMRVFREETFGPLSVVIRVPDESAAIAVANDNAYGLGASVWTRDTERGKRLAEQLDVGMVFVNEIVVSDARLPFGGFKRSGYGRELGEWGIREFTGLKAIAVSESPVSDAPSVRSEQAIAANE